ncbi:carboxypeptidase regulatory-like domain-containing protein [Caldiplasma sukawensis]
MESNFETTLRKARFWFVKNWELVGLFILISIYLFLSNFYIWGQAFIDGAPNFSGGSDPYFNYIFLQYIITHHSTLLYTTNINYPIGSHNPRNPFFHWMLAFVAEITAPLFGGALKAAYYAFNEFDAVFGALLIIPVYLLGKDIIGKKGGMIGAILYTLMPSNLTSGILTDGRMHTPELIFAFFAIYFFERAVRFAKKDRVIEGSIFNLRGYKSSLLKFYRRNKRTTYYALLAGASYGALMLSWQGHAYILAIITIYVVVQLVANLFLSKSNAHLLYISTIFVFLAFAMGGYYYYAADNAPSIWYIPPLIIGLGLIFVSALLSIIGRKPWIISVPVIAIVTIVSLSFLDVFAHHIFFEIISGEGYFIKTRVYSTIAEAQAPPLGEYIAGFGVAQFLLGVGGIVLVVYEFFRKKDDGLLFLLVFSLVSIYMSFAAARFNITAAPAYAILGGALIVYIARIVKMDDTAAASGVKKLYRRQAGLKGNIRWLQIVFVLLLVGALLIPSGLSDVSAAVPANSAAHYNRQVYNSLPSFAQNGSFNPNNDTYFGATGSLVVNSSSPIAMSFSWLSTQQSGIPINEKPAYVSWWDYGFEELCQGKHPTVADDFQQAYQVAGQVLLSTNESQIIALFSARLLQAEYEENNGLLPGSVASVMLQYMNSSELNLVNQIYSNPLSYRSWISDNSSVYGKFIPGISAQNAYFALLKGQFASKMSLNKLINFYQALQEVTGYSIQYIGVDHNLLPVSGLDTGIFYAPAYLTDQPSYTASDGAVVPYDYYNVFAVTANGTFPLNDTPADVVPISYEISYTPAFYNTTIYRAVVGLPPGAVGQTNGIPGYTYGTNQYPIVPAYNMSNFEVCYAAIPYNPYSNITNHENNFVLKPLNEAYKLQEEKNGTAVIFPTLADIYTVNDPILRYFPGAIVEGQVTDKNGNPVPGIRVTILDQYGVPHQTVLTNQNGYYNITGLPGNDTLVFSYGNLKQANLEGSIKLNSTNIYISRSQAERKDLSINVTTGLPQFYVVKNLVLKNYYSNGTVSMKIPTENGTITDNALNGTICVNTSTGEHYGIVRNGNFSISGIPLGSYNASFNLSGVKYSNVGNITVSSTLSTNNITIKIPKVEVSVSEFNNPVNNATIYINNSEYKTEKDGQYILGLRPGTYTVYSRYGSLVSNITTLTITSYGSNNSVNLNLTVGAKLTLNINGVNNGTVRLLEDGIINKNYNLTIKNGTGSSILPLGYYTVYYSNDGYGLSSSFVFNHSTVLNLSAEKMYSINIFSNNQKFMNFTGYTSIVSSSSNILIPFNGSKMYSVMETYGNSYEIYSSTSYLGNYSSSYTSILLDKNVTVNLGYVSSVSKVIGVFNNNFGSVETSKNEYHNGIVIVNSVEGINFAVPVVNGYANIITQTSVYSGYYVKSIAGGFESPNEQLSSTKYLNPNIPTGKVTLNFIPTMSVERLDGKIRLISKENVSFDIVNGSITFTAPEGAYYMKLFGGNQYVLSYNNLLYINTSSHVFINLSYVPKVSLSINGNVNYSIYNSTGVSVKNTTEISPGFYTVYAYNITGASITKLNVVANMSYVPVLEKSYYLNISVANNEFSHGDYEIISDSGVGFNTSSNSIVLPSGNYKVLYFENYVNATGEYKIRGEENYSLQSNINYYMSLRISQFRTTIEFKVNNFNETGISSLCIFKNGYPVMNGTTDSSGQFSTEINNGTYSIYAYSIDYQYAYTGTFTIGYFQNYSFENLTLVPSGLVQLTTSIGKNIVNNYVNVTSSNFFGRFRSGGNEIKLPHSNYTFVSSITGSFSVNNYNTTYGYVAGETTFVGSYVAVQLDLRKEVFGNVNVTQGQVFNIREYGGFKTYLTLINRLNENTSFNLSSENSTWKISFTPSSTAKIDINGSINLNVSVEDMSVVPAGLNLIPINVKYSGGNQTVYIKVNIIKQYGVSLSTSQSSIIYNGGNGLFYVKATNTGNTNETINISILNLSKISKDFGWKILTQLNGKNITEINLNFQESVTINLLLIPNSSVFSSSLVFTMEGTVIQNTSYMKTLNLTLVTPGAPGVIAYPRGNNIISNYTGAPIDTLLYGVIIIMVAVIGGLAVIAIKGRRKK